MKFVFFLFLCSSFSTTPVHGAFSLVETFYDDVVVAVFPKPITRESKNEALKTEVPSSDEKTITEDINFSESLEDELSYAPTPYPLSEWNYFDVLSTEAFCPNFFQNTEVCEYLYNCGFVFLSFCREQLLEWS